MNRKFYSPDIAVSAGGQLVAEEKKKRKKGYTPGADDNFKATAERTCASWQNNPGITLAWVTQEEMQTYVTTFSAELAERKTLGGDRPSITSTIELLNIDIDTAVNNVKVYIEKKYRKANAKPQFARFGIIKEDRNYRLPRDHNKRYDSLDLMIDAIAKDDFGKEEYGTAFWTAMKLNFGNAITSASGNDGSVSGKVSGKNVAREKLDKIMTSLRKVLMANYPDTYPAVLREWGWLK